MAGAIVGDDDIKLNEIIGARVRANMEKERKEKEKMHRLQNADMFDVEAQK